MIIDSHHHLWKYDPVNYDWIDASMVKIARDFTIKDARKIMQAEGVTGSVAVQARQSDAETRWLLEVADSNDFLKGVVGWIDLESPEINTKLNEYNIASKLVGFRHVLQSEPDNRHVMRPDFLRGLKALAETGYRYDILIFERQLRGALDVMGAINELDCVIDHIAKPDMTSGPSDVWADNIRAIAKETRAYCKLSGMATEADWANWSYDSFAPYLDILLEAFGEDRLMFGSDWPVCLVAGSYGKVKGVIETFIIRNCPDAAHKVWAQNAVDFYGLA